MRKLLLLAQVICISLLTMSNQDSDDEKVQFFLENAGKNFDPDNAPTVHRSSRLANKSPPPLIADWPAEKIIMMLYSHNIQPPLGINHEELFQFFLETNSEMPATPFNFNSLRSQESHCQT